MRRVPQSHESPSKDTVEGNATGRQSVNDTGMRAWCRGQVVACCSDGEVLCWGGGVVLRWRVVAV